MTKKATNAKRKPKRKAVFKRKVKAKAKGIKTHKGKGVSIKRIA